MLKPVISIAFLDASGEPIPMIAWSGSTDKLAITQTNMPTDEA